MGLLLLIALASSWRRLNSAFLLRTAAVTIALVALYFVVALAVKKGHRTMAAFHHGFLALLPLLAVYLLGMHGGPVFGDGEGQFAAVAYVGISLVITALTGDRGCEVLAIPRFLVRSPASVPCVFFYATDRLEDRLSRPRSSGQVPPTGK